MYRLGLQFTWVPMNQPQVQQHEQPLLVPPPPFIQVNPFAMQSGFGTMPWYGEGFNNSGWSFPLGPVYQGMAPNLQYQYQNQYSGYRAPTSSGPSRNSRQHTRGFRQAGAPYPQHRKHESAGTIAQDRSLGIHPGTSMAQMTAKQKTGVGMVWRTPSDNPLMID